MTGAQQFQEVHAALRAGRAKPGEVIIADLGADPIPGLVTVDCH
jgi:hypothetical protein